MPAYKQPPFLPEGVQNPYMQSRPWTVNEAPAHQSAVNFDACSAHVPRNVNEYTDLIHWHEMAHVRWTEGRSIFGQTEPGMWDHILREPQVNTLLARELNVDVSQAMRVFDWTTQEVPLIPRDAGILWINIAYYLRDRGNTALHEFAGRLEARIREQWNGNMAMDALVEAVQAVIAEPTTLTRQTHSVTLAELFAPPPPAPELEPEVDGKTAKDMADAEADDRKAEDREKASLERELKHQIAAGSLIDNMEVHEHLTKARPGRRLSSPGSHRDTGIIPVKFERYCTDKMLFRIRKTTGSLVIDCSGSMHWDWDALQDALKKLPNMVVGCYQGFSDDVRGRLCVIARNGRWSDYQPTREPGGLCGNNTVDYQALLWLASQPKPRVWLSDGDIVGGNHLNTHAKCTELMERARIVRITSMDAALRYFRGKPAPIFTESKPHGRQLVLRKAR